MTKPTVTDWQAAATKEVKGKDLTWHTPEGIDVNSLYSASARPPRNTARNRSG